MKTYTIIRDGGIMTINGDGYSINNDRLEIYHVEDPDGTNRKVVYHATFASGAWKTIVEGAVEFKIGGTDKANGGQ